MKEPSETDWNREILGVHDRIDKVEKSNNSLFVFLLGVLIGVLVVSGKEKK